MSTPTRRPTTNAAQPRVDAANWTEYGACADTHPDVFTDDDRQKLLALHARGWSAGRIAGELHTNTQTVNRALRELDDQAALDAVSEAVAA